MSDPDEYIDSIVSMLIDGLTYEEYEELKEEFELLLVD